MTSLMCVRMPGGTVRIHNDEVADKLAINSNDPIKTHVTYTNTAEGQRLQNGQQRPHSTPNPHGHRRNMDSRALIGHTLKIQDWLNDKSVKAVQEKSDLEARKTKKMYTSVLDTENTFGKELEDLLYYKELLNLRRKEMLHKKWNKQVYEPLRSEINKEMDGPHYSAYCKRKRELYKEYLEHVNKKGHVFLDTFAPAEYYPMSLHPARPVFTAKTKRLQDPLLCQERALMEEDRCTLSANMSDEAIRRLRLPSLPLVPLGRHGTQCRTWLAMPMGDIESPVRMSSRHRMQGIYNDSTIDFEQWSQQHLDPALIDKEMQLQKRRSFPPEPTISEVRAKIYAAACSSPSTESVEAQVES